MAEHSADLSVEHLVVGSVENWAECSADQLAEQKVDLLVAC